MESAIVGFERDEVGDWMALLECGHRQHVRHNPPWQDRAWVVSADGRAERIGSPLECRNGDEDRSAGDPACWVEQVCRVCGGLDGHRPGCTEVMPRADS